MANTAEKIVEIRQEPPQKTVEQWLREDVTKIYDATRADPSRCESADVVFDRLLAEFSD